MHKYLDNQHNKLNKISLIFSGPHKWIELFSAASGKRQSPIDIQTNNVQKYTPNKPLRATYDIKFCNMDLTNSGHAWQVNVQAKEKFAGCFN